MACRTDPAKSIPEDISLETQAIIERKTGKRYVDPRDLPSKLDLSGCTGVVDVSSLGGVKYLDLRWCTGITDFSAVPHAHR